MTQDTPNSSHIPRAVTGERMLNAFLFIFILHLVGTILAVVVLFQHFYSLITMGPPIARLTQFADRLTRYSFEIFQYLTYNSDQSPFPFQDLPTENESPLEHGVTT